MGSPLYRAQGVLSGTSMYMYKARSDVLVEVAMVSEKERALFALQVTSQH